MESDAKLGAGVAVADLSTSNGIDGPLGANLRSFNPLVSPMLTDM
jgi:hypothetical protein